jgi:hypothetical protein
VLVIEYTRTDVADGTIIFANNYITKITSKITVDIEENISPRVPTNQDILIKQVIKLQVVNSLSEAHNKLAARGQLTARA